MHARGLVHGALAPKHIVRVRSEAYGVEHEYKLLGLSSLHLAREPSRARSVSGVVEYASPEMRIAGTPVDGRADLYSIGMLLYALVAGSPPRVELEESEPPDLMAEVDGVDSHLNEVGFIVPGLGDAGDRQYGVD